MLIHDAGLAEQFTKLRRARLLARERFLAGRKGESFYRRNLTQVARQIDAIVRGMAPQGVVTDLDRLLDALNRYADILKPWGESVANQMIADVAKRDAAAWEKHGREIGQALRREIMQAPTGAAMRSLLREQVDEITLLPRKAAERLFRVTTEGLVTGIRAEEIAQQVLATGQVSVGQARMLARTGVSTTATSLTQARAQYMGSEGYTWRTSRDLAVRPSHRKMEGKFIRWDSPPTIDNYTAHCGQFANCRCFPEVQIPDRFRGV